MKDGGGYHDSSLYLATQYEAPDVGIAASVEPPETL